MTEDERQRELAKCLRQRMILMDQLRQMQQTIRDSKRSLGDTLVGRVDLGRVATFAHYSGQTAVRAQQIVQKLAAVEKQVDEARQRLLAAVKDRKALELLRDQRFEAWRQEQERREAADLDEMAIQGFVRAAAAESSAA